MKIKDKLEKLNSQEFYELMQYYRHIPIEAKEHLKVEAFENVKNFIIKLLW